MIEHDLFKYEILGVLKNGRVNGLIMMIKAGQMRSSKKLDFEKEMMDLSLFQLKITYSIITQPQFANI